MCNFDLEQSHLRKFERKFLETSEDDYLADFENK